MNEKNGINKEGIVRVLGIDPGFSGALVLVDSETKEILRMELMPVITVEKKKSRKVRKTEEEFGQQKTKSYTGKYTMIDIYKLNELFKELSKVTDIAYLEHVHARPMEGVSSTFRFGQGYGNLEAFLVAHNINFKNVPAPTWASVIHAGIPKTIDAKGKSLMMIKKLYPNTNFVIKKTDHDGLIDATLIATYGIEMEKNNVKS